MFPINPPFTLFADVDGEPLQSGYIYIGTANQNPEVNAIPVYWDEAGTLVATQPLRTISGYISRNGSPANIYLGSDYSITVRDRNSVMVYTKRTSRDVEGLHTKVSAYANVGGATNSLAYAKITALPMVYSPFYNDSTIIVQLQFEASVTELPAPDSARGDFRLYKDGVGIGGAAAFTATSTGLGTGIAAGGALANFFTNASLTDINFDVYARCYNVAANVEASSIIMVVTEVPN